MKIFIENDYHFSQKKKFTLDKWSLSIFISDVKTLKIIIVITETKQKKNEEMSTITIKTF